MSAGAVLRLQQRTNGRGPVQCWGALSTYRKTEKKKAHNANLSTLPAGCGCRGAGNLYRFVWILFANVGTKLRQRATEKWRPPSTKGRGGDGTGTATELQANQHERGRARVLCGPWLSLRAVCGSTAECTLCECVCVCVCLCSLPFRSSLTGPRRARGPGDRPSVCVCCTHFLSRVKETNPQSGFARLAPPHATWTSEVRPSRVQQADPKRNKPKNHPKQHWRKKF